MNDAASLGVVVFLVVNFVIMKKPIHEFSMFWLDDLSEAGANDGRTMMEVPLQVPLGAGMSKRFQLLADASQEGSKALEKLGGDRSVISPNDSFDVRCESASEGVILIGWILKLMGLGMSLEKTIVR